MRIDLSPGDVWENLNEKLSAFLKLPAEVSVRVAPSLHVGVFEATRGVTQFFGHKKNMGLIKGLSPIFDPLMPSLYKDAYQVQAALYNEIPDAKAWVEALKKDTNFVLFAEDHPVTAELFNWDELDQLLNEKKIFSIRVSHHAHLRADHNLRPFSVRVCSFAPNLSLMVYGNKFKCPPLVIHKMYWEENQILEQVRTITELFSEDEKLIQDFETKAPVGYNAYLKGKSRLWDRALLYSENHNSEALLQFIQQKLDGKVLAPGFHQTIETTNQCRWGGISLYEPWWVSRPEEKVLRGLLLFSCGLIKLPNLPGILEQALTECRI